MSDRPNRRPADPQQPTTGNEPSLRRLFDQLEVIRTAEETEAEEASQIAQLQRQITDLMQQITALEGQVQEFRQTRFERTGYVFDVQPRAHDRAHPEIVKHSICEECGQSFSYQVYATGWTRTYCDECRPRRRRQMQAAAARRRRAEQRRMSLNDGTEP